MNEKSGGGGNEWCILTKLLISHILIALEYINWHQSDAKTLCFYLMVSDKKILFEYS